MAGINGLNGFSFPTTTFNPNTGIGFQTNNNFPLTTSSGVSSNNTALPMGQMVMSMIYMMMSLMQSLFSGSGLGGNNQNTPVQSQPFPGYQYGYQEPIVSNDANKPAYVPPIQTDTATSNPYQSPVSNTPPAADQESLPVGNAPYCPPGTTPVYTPPSYEGGNKGQYWGDPHLVGFDGEKYDVMGQPGKIYNMLSDQNVQYNTKFDAWGNDGATIISEAAMQVGQDRVLYDRSGNAPTVNGVALEKGKTVQLSDKGSATWDGSQLVVNTGEYTIDLKTVENAQGNYLDSNVTINQGGPFSDFVAPHGLLGQTADGVAGAHVGDLGQDQGKQGGTVIDGTVADYEVADLWNNNFKFNRFGATVGQTIADAAGNVSRVLDTNGKVVFEAPIAPVGQKAASS